MMIEQRGRKDWNDYVSDLLTAGSSALSLQPESNTPQDKQEAIQAFLGAISAAYLMKVYSDPNYPEFIPMWNSAFNVLGPVPDTIYSYTLIDGSGVYLIRGWRNTVRYAEITINRGSWEDASMGPVAVVDLDDLQLNADTSFELILSSDRPAGYEGNWISITPEVTSLLVRSQAYDWLAERDSVLAIERLDVPASRPRQSAEELERRISGLGPLAEVIQASSYGRVQRSFDENLLNSVESREYAGPNWVKVYLEGLYQLSEDEALVIETSIPTICRYWSVILLDTNKGSLDWINHQSSLNGFQASIDADGKFRGVISLVDPGVPNWLDPGGHPLGVMQIRWDKCDSHPSPSFTKVRIDQLRSVLPESTPYVSPAQRDDDIRKRRLGAQLRRKW